MAALVPPATHTAHADDAVAQTVEVSSYDDLKNVVERIGDNDRSGHTIVVKKDIAFDQMITLSKGQHITLVSDSATCAGTCRLTYSAPAIADHNFSLFNVYGDSSITIGTGAEDTDRLAFSGEANGRLLLVGTDTEGVNQHGWATINGGAFSRNSRGRQNTTGDGNIAYVYPQGNLSVNGGAFEDNYAAAFANPVTMPTGTTKRSGGAVIHSQGTVSINGGTFDGNTTQANGVRNPGFHGGGAIWSDGTLTINNGTFTNNVSNAQHFMPGYDADNTVDQDKYPTGGGAIWARGRLTINGGTFSNNWQKDKNAQYYATGGGAIYFGDGSTKDNGVMVVNGGTFDHNYSMQDGGAIFVTWNSKAVFQQGAFTDNWANRLGGAVYTEEDTTSYVTNAAAYDNKAGHFGGGLWLCPSGVAKESNNGGMVMFNNTADTKYDADENGNQSFPDDGKDDRNYTNTGSYQYGAAGDDFAIMYPNKENINQNSFKLTRKWFTGDATSWYEDGTPSGTANGFTYGQNDLATTSDSKRYASGDKAYDTDVNGNIEITQTKVDPSDPRYRGYGFKSVAGDDTKNVEAAQQASIRFTGNTARLSGGAFGTNGSVDFVRTYSAKWNKVNSLTKAELGGSQWLMIAGEDAGPYSLRFGDPAECALDSDGNLRPTAGAWCTIPKDGLSDTYQSYAGQHALLINDNESGNNGSASETVDTGLDKNGASGEFLIRGLQNGSYTLMETTAPEGFKRAKGVYTFTITDGNNPRLTGVDAADGTGVLDGYNIPNKPYGTVVWRKVDASSTDTLLGGSTWTLKDSKGNILKDDIADCTSASDCPASRNETATYTDVDPTPGVIKLKYLKLGDYTLTEKTAPTGYTKSDATYSFSITKDNHKNVAIVGLTDNKVPNTRILGTVSWSKFDDKETTDADLLAGSKWKLTQTKDWQGNDIASGSQQSWTITDCATSSGNCTAGQNAYADSDAKAGKFTLANLAWGTYKLVETKAPDGYQLPDGDKVYYTFTIDAQHLTPTLTASTEAGSYLVDNGKGVKNERLKVNLPSTGSPGGMLAYVLGGVAVLGLGSCMIARSGTERKEDRA
uniref:MSCRAMM family protein n=1 Tax=Bifidobacterium adolescentis TaxID=1680 RepID=UPI00359CB655